MNILSLFDGISCARVALDRAGIKVNNYYASEIDKYAIQVSSKNWSDIIQVGSVTDICYGKYDGNGGYDYPKESFFKNRKIIMDNGIGIDLLIGGSPCQNLSAAGNGKGLEGSESKLFYEFIRILEEVKPKYFILENVASMSPSNRDKISEIIGVSPIMINSNLISAQDRKRYFWTNIPNITLPEKNNLFLKDILNGDEVDITERMLKKVKGTLAYKKTWGNIRTLEQKSKTLTVGGQNISNSGATNILKEDGRYYALSPIDCERLQSLPDNYTDGISNTQRYKCCGNAFNADVIAHILSFIK